MQHALVVATLAAALLWPCGELRPLPAASWWCVPPGAAVRVVGGVWGLNVAEGAAVSVLWAQGAWSRVEVDGEVVGSRVWLPVVAR